VILTSFFLAIFLPYANRTLVHAFPEAGLGVSIAVDGCVYQSDVFAASAPAMGSPHSGARRYKGKGHWGGRAVLVLLGIRLGLDGVNPIYYDTIKVRTLAHFIYLFTLLIAPRCSF
jgi:hypothetical protein